jgi:hypothetical protein
VVTIVGEAPGRRVGPDGPLADSRLPAYAGVDRATFLACRRANVYPYPTSRWSAPEARRRAGRLTFPEGSTVLLLGRRVAAAFGVRGGRWLDTVDLPGRDVHALLVPHPSGRCRVWNDPAFRARARPVLHNLLWRT